jgi:hypothetical protein
VKSGLRSILDGIFGEFRPSIFGAFFGLHFRPLFGPRSVCNLLVLRDFFVREEDFWPLFRPIFHCTFALVFTRFGTRLVLRVVFGPRSIVYPSAL